VLDEELAKELNEIDAGGLRRRLREVATAQGEVVEIDGVRVINFSSNNYLGLADHPALVDAAGRALREAGAGAGAARLIVGNLRVHGALERRLAGFVETEAALLFTSGYQANVGVLAALAGAEDALFSDALNHASLIDGCRLSRARVHVYRHGDLDDLATALRATRARRRFIVTDTVFSMDGDLAPLPALRELADRYGAHLVIDEAHATGVLGPGGRGLAARDGIRAEVHIATLGKALGAFGAFVAGSRTLVDFLLHRARSFIFTTALPPSVAAAALAGVELAASPEGEARRRRLTGNVERFRQALAARGLLARGAGTSPIFPILVGDERRAMEATRRLLERGLYAQAIRTPTVAPGAARLRLALMATHTREHLDAALDGLDALAKDGILAS
jgi:8-amino-7-oxononanoate synthase